MALLSAQASLGKTATDSRSVHPFPPTSISFPRSPHLLVLQTPLGTGEMFKQGPTPLGGKKESLGAREKAMPSDIRAALPQAGQRREWLFLVWL